MKEWQARRRRNVKRLLGVAALSATVATAMVVPGTVLAAGERPHPVGCTFVSTMTGLIYEGEGQVVLTPGGRSVASCAATLLDGQTPVSQTTRSTFTWGTSDQECSAIETPNGEARFFCVGEVS
jgi:hypothetical protein